MMRRVLTLVLGIALSTVLLSSANAQTFEETLNNMSSDAAKAYVNPIVSGFGVNLNGGWFHRAPRATMFGFDLEIGVVGMETFFKDDAKTFNSNGTFSFNDQQAASLTTFVDTDPRYAGLSQLDRDNLKLYLQNQITAQSFTLGISGPTIVGSSNDSIAIAFASKTYNNAPVVGSVTVPGQRVVLPVTAYLGELKALPFLAPQLSIGIFLGSEFTFRYIRLNNIQNLGTLKYFGWGIQHNPGIWLGPADILPVDLSLSFFTQDLQVGGVFETKATAFGVNVSKRLGWGFLNLTPYAGLMFEKSTMSFAYDFYAPDPTSHYQATKLEHVKFDLESANKSRLVVGLSFKLLIVNINADYNIGKYNSATAGIMIII